MIGFVLFGVGSGVGLAGRVGTCAVVAIVVAFDGVQILVCRWWLGRFAYRPAEWVWRALTYGKMPPLKILRAG